MTNDLVNMLRGGLSKGRGLVFKIALELCDAVVEKNNRIFFLENEVNRLKSEADKAYKGYKFKP